MACGTDIAGGTGGDGRHGGGTVGSPGTDGIPAIAGVFGTGGDGTHSPAVGGGGGGRRRRRRRRGRRAPPAAGTWGGGGGGGAGSSYAGTDVRGRRAAPAEVSITYTAPGPPPPVGTSDLKVFLKHQGVFQHHRLGTYGIWVTNTGTAATVKAHPMVVTLATGRGILMVQGGKGTGWQCHKAGPCHVVHAVDTTGRR